MAMPITSNIPAWADSPPKLNKNTDPEILKQYLRKCNGMIAQNKATAGVYSTKGQLLEWLKEYKSAVNAYSKALKLSPGNRIFLIGRARTYRKSKKFDKALADYNSLINSKNRTAEIYTGRALTRLGLGNYQESLKDANISVSIDSNERLAWYAKGSSEAHLGLLKSSVASLTKAIELDPNDPTFLIRRSQVYNKLGYGSKADKDLILARKLSK